MASDIVFVPAEPGLGHCVRSLAIADQITADSTYDVEFVAGPLCYPYIEEEGFQVHSTPCKDYLQETILEFSTLIRCIKPRIIVSDDHIVATISASVAGIPSFFVTSDPLWFCNNPEYLYRWPLKFVIADYPDHVPTPPSLRDRTVYVGATIRKYDYPEDKNAVREYLKLSKEAFLIVINFGGSTYATQLILQLLRTLKGEWHTIVLSPSGAHSTLLKQEAPADNLTIVTRTHKPQAYLYSSDLAIIHCGHNTLLETYFSKTPALMVPLITREVPASTAYEQLTDGERMEQCGGGLLIYPHQLANLSSIVEQVVTHPEDLAHLQQLRLNSVLKDKGREAASRLLIDYLGGSLNVHI